MKEDMTTIAIKKSTWNMLNAHKKCGESMDDVIIRLFGKSLSKIQVGGEPVYG
jgi:predicted CopG family antitoxin